MAPSFRVTVTDPKPNATIKVTATLKVTKRRGEEIVSERTKRVKLVHHSNGETVYDNDPDDDAEQADELAQDEESDAAEDLEQDVDSDNAVNFHEEEDFHPDEEQDEEEEFDEEMDLDEAEELAEDEEDDEAAAAEANTGHQHERYSDVLGEAPVPQSTPSQPNSDPNRYRGAFSDSDPDGDNPDDDDPEGFTPASPTHDPASPSYEPSSPIYEPDNPTYTPHSPPYQPHPPIPSPSNQSPIPSPSAYYDPPSPPPRRPFPLLADNPPIAPNLISLTAELINQIASHLPTRRLTRLRLTHPYLASATASLFRRRYWTPRFPPPPTAPEDRVAAGLEWAPQPGEEVQKELCWCFGQGFMRKAARSSAVIISNPELAREVTGLKVRVYPCATREETMRMWPEELEKFRRFLGNLRNLKGVKVVGGTWGHGKWELDFVRGAVWEVVEELAVARVGRRNATRRLERFQLTCGPNVDICRLLKGCPPESWETLRSFLNQVKTVKIEDVVDEGFKEPDGFEEPRQDHLALDTLSVESFGTQDTTDSHVEAEPSSLIWFLNMMPRVERATFNFSRSWLFDALTAYGPVLSNLQRLTVEGSISSAALMRLTFSFRHRLRYLSFRWLDITTDGAQSAAVAWQGLLNFFVQRLTNLYSAHFSKVTTNSRACKFSCDRFTPAVTNTDCLWIEGDGTRTALNHTTVVVQ